MKRGRDTTNRGYFRDVKPRSLNIHRRCGATAVETAIVLLAFLMLVFGMLELGIAALRHNVVSHAARQAARRAIVRGELAPPQLNAWGPQEYSARADSSDEIADTIRPFLSGLDPARTTIQMQWIDGDIVRDSRVRVTVSTDHDPFLTFLFLSGWTFTGVSTMSIAH